MPPGGTIATLTVLGGEIRLQRRKEDGRFVALAVCSKHANCYKERGMGIMKRGGRTKGRPLGFCCAWLARGMHATVATQAQHTKGVIINRQDRLQGRSELETEAAGPLHTFLEKERQAR